ncbi:MAG: hypothetical protein JW820_12905 [Spirochaetales bacterium]|nr:hypothetical protein [Spirochaetales bacterium]
MSWQQSGIPRDASINLIDIQESVSPIETYVAGYSFKRFRSDQDTTWASAAPSM